MTDTNIDCSVIMDTIISCMCYKSEFTVEEYAKDPSLGNVTVTDSETVTFFERNGEYYFIAIMLTNPNDVLTDKLNWGTGFRWVSSIFDNYNYQDHNYPSFSGQLIFSDLINNYKPIRNIFDKEGCNTPYSRSESDFIIIRDVLNDRLDRTTRYKNNPDFRTPSYYPDYFRTINKIKLRKHSNGIVSKLLKQYAELFDKKDAFLQLGQKIAELSATGKMESKGIKDFYKANPKSVYNNDYHYLNPLLDIMLSLSYMRDNDNLYLEGISKVEGPHIYSNTDDTEHNKKAKDESDIIYSNYVVMTDIGLKHIASNHSLPDKKTLQEFLDHGQELDRLKIEAEKIRVKTEKMELEIKIATQSIFDEIVALIYKIIEHNNSPHKNYRDVLAVKKIKNRIAKLRADKKIIEDDIRLKYKNLKENNGS